MKQNLNNKNNSMRDPYPLSFKEEVGNAISHGALMFAFLLALPYFSLQAWLKGSWIQMVGTSIYMICMFLMLCGSFLYHIMPHNTMWKYIFRKVDHSMILLAIAGTYTPICLSLLSPTLAAVILTIEWVLAAGGIILKAVSTKTHAAISMTLYMIMGWLAVLILPVLLKTSSWPFLLLIAAGGVFYTIGACFFSMKRPWTHFIWHLFIDAAAICHFTAIVCFL